MITLLDNLPDNVVGAEAVGEVTDGDYEQTLVPAINAARERHGAIRILYVLGEGFEGYSAGAMWEDAKLGLAHPRSFEKIAIVTDSESIRAGVKLLGWMIHGEISVFPASELTRAREWILA